MTVGNPLGLILQFAFPLLIGNLLQQTYNLADAAIVGRYLGSNALASVGASGSVQFLVLGFCIGLCCGFGIPVAQRFGATDYKRMRDFIFHAAVLTAGIAAVLTAVCLALCPKILRLLNTPDSLYEDAYGYLFIIFLGIPFNLLYNLTSGILRAVGDSKTPFVFLATATVLNILMDLFFIRVLGFGCMGAGLATVLAQAVSGMLCFLYIKKKVSILHLAKENKKWDLRTAGLMFCMGVPMGLQYSVTAIGTMVMQSANNGLGDVYISGFTAAARLKQFAMCPFDAVATGVSTFAGQNLGAGKIRRIKQGIRHGVLIGAAYGAAIGLVLFFFGRNMALMFINREETAVLDAAGKYLKALGCFCWTLGFLNICRMTVQGIGFTLRAVFSGVVEMAARIIVSVLFVPLYGFTAVCFADQTAWVCACIYIVPTCICCVRKCARKINCTEKSAII